MHIETAFGVPFSPYPSPPSLASSDGSYQQDFFNMGANTNVNMDGTGVLNYQRAIDIARNTEGDLDPTISAYLEGALTDIWGRISLQPETYIMSKDEFAIFNFYRRRFDENEVAEHAVARFWAHTHDAPATAA
ncbi:hypothetical protein CLAFUW4_13711 [Fulvia fulva]|uniref:Uncharacterized protein n=1 Tax=Passalora fulva TaxID=5499 RepID=A0A9Q8PLD7_PASFU|nr:uncharacterized protein CLAFUR5_13560 [Fulvia fulva]KAK4610382.1 hypothetical protein CLAFUR4_13714 [Fulvia fulva]KAK4611082.1 hypothetical protein CLAFUR0_13718 [Fulvia fulva]UJO24532.1 hypothetical protein CLAFUR5_13560 [Fulvia fulva]WPV22185.1 hypothetical protein CLAFUW4_13711 [Fulvia fulva]WPV36850.1 hypothetical protein CLAFUW7_13719 [Fulvia fulva]